MDYFGFPTFLFFLNLLFISSRISFALDTINPNQPLRDGDTLVSAGQRYELGFFSLADPNRRYLGLWYKNISPRTFVWVANRENPLSNNLGSLNITRQGNLVIANIRNEISWSTYIPTIAKEPVAKLLDSGNLIVRDANDSNEENILWQSFDHPADTLLPGMKLGGSLGTGSSRFLSSWKSKDDPAAGEFHLQIDVRGYPQLILNSERGILMRAGSWNGLSFAGDRPNSVFEYEFVLNVTDVYYKYEVRNSSMISRFTLNPDGVAQRSIWNDTSSEWMLFSSSPADECENYALCGAYGTCDISSSDVCSCLEGFKPKSPRDWNLRDWSAGCVPRQPIECNNDDIFIKHERIKLPDTSSSWFDRSLSLAECEGLCAKNCSCFAYANLDIRDKGSGCLRWFGNLIDIRESYVDEQDLYVRLAAPKLEGSGSNLKAGIIAGCVSLSIITMLLFLCIWRRKNVRKYVKSKISYGENNANFTDNEEEMDLPLFKLHTITEATNNFSSINKLGQGGFGPVYKGTLMEGQEIAVKRLSKSSGQGLKEFKTEVILLVKLQHRNLVKLLGCCIHKDDKMLVYEYMPNRSLDSFIFDQTRSKMLDWPTRIHIIDGIARGLVYLHQDSRLRIIHRDLKLSNILLDSNMNPKISDFGMARIFGVDQTEGNTKRVVGTYGYMSPEYAVDGLFSVKSDVFSFGVMVLEIVSGKKNRGFCHPDHDRNLVGHAYMLWTKGTPLEIVDECLTDSLRPSEVVRCINIALLCAQQRPEDRPNMSSVVVMLSSEIRLPEPKQPGFFLERNPPEASISSNSHQSFSANEVSVTLLKPR
ncbi:G-type lectin S-receptor-like serine/threonine-protein kinase At4g27290 isoform X2 [Euphorbia lathyris]|uniref:G-type lectin S-receptor-like serine/threonine-protein kinase At4g27290 isoform X1 n=1 Tax=Euphorbia lathyris TaxID=212925 RepID=UPI003314075B